jgi:hypothetical protein
MDVDCANWLAECEVPFCIVFTKTDASKKDGPAPARCEAQRIAVLFSTSQIPFKSHVGRNKTLIPHGRNYTHLDDLGEEHLNTCSLPPLFFALDRRHLTSSSELDAIRVPYSA